MPLPKLNCVLIIIFTLTLSTPATKAAKKESAKPPFKTVIFADDFSTQELGDIWKAYKSESKIENGVLVGLKPVDADHNAVDSVTTKAYSDVEVTLDFQFSGSPLFVIAFNEHKFKGSHAGHICRVVVTPKRVVLRDGKTGVFKNDIFELRNSGSLDSKTKALLKTKEVMTKVNFEQDKWYQLLVRIQGDRMTLFVDGKKISELKSEGIAHQTKNKLSLVTSKQAMHFDNFKITAP